jgi:hypothetical protein
MFDNPACHLTFLFCGKVNKMKPKTSTEYCVIVVSKTTKKVGFAKQ